MQERNEINVCGWRYVKAEKMRRHAPNAQQFGMKASNENKYVCVDEACGMYKNLSRNGLASAAHDAKLSFGSTLQSGQPASVQLMRNAGVRMCLGSVCAAFCRLVRYMIFLLSKFPTAMRRRSTPKLIRLHAACCILLDHHGSYSACANSAWFIHTRSYVCS